MLNKFLINRETTVNYPYNKVVGWFSREKDMFRVYEEDNGYKIIAKWSLGTLQVKGMPGLVDGIKVYVRFEELNSSATKIYISTRLRIELVFVTLVLLFLTCGLIMHGDYEPWTLLFLPVIPIFFWGVYRAQENALAEKVESFISRHN